MKTLKEFITEARSGVANAMNKTAADTKKNREWRDNRIANAHMLSSVFGVEKKAYRDDLAKTLKAQRDKKYDGHFAKGGPEYTANLAAGSTVVRNYLRNRG